MPAVGIRTEEALPECGDVPSEPFAAVQQIELRPEIRQTVWRGGSGQLDKAGDVRLDPRQRLETLRPMVLEAARFVNDHHIEPPVVPQVIDQPDDVLAVDNVHVRRRTDRPDPLLLAAEDEGEPQVPEVLPLCRLG